MTYNFDEVPQLKNTDSAKWHYVDEGTLPMWVAVMDFQAPQPVIDAMASRVQEGIFGYVADPKELRDVLVARMQRLYNWTIKPEDIVFLQGVIAGITGALRSIGKPGDGVLMTTPVYGPFHGLPGNNGRFANKIPLIANQNGQTLTYDIDFAAFEAALTDQTSLFTFCNPHNPIGHVYTRAQLERIAEICLKHNVAICSDEIHCDLLLNGARHIPIASLSPEIAAKTITLMAPSKTFNLAGLVSAFAIIQDEDLRNQFQKSLAGTGHVNVMGYVSTLAAYRDSQGWLDEVLAYLQGNHDLVTSYLAECLPEIRMAKMEGTYLAWLDCNALKIEGTAADFFKNEAKVAVNGGEWFGDGGAGFVRLNFACPRPMLQDALERMRVAVEKIR